MKILLPLSGNEKEVFKYLRDYVFFFQVRLEDGLGTVCLQVAELWSIVGKELADLPLLCLHS